MRRLLLNCPEGAKKIALKFPGQQPIRVLRAALRVTRLVEVFPVESKFMKRIVTAVIGSVLLLVSGCERKEVKVHARHHVPDTKGERTVTRWKEADLKAPGYGLIIEQEAAKVSATLYRVEPGEGFVIKEKASDGKFFAEKKEIIFPLFMQGVISVEDWVSANGSHVVVSFDATFLQATNLTGELRDMARKGSYNFVRLPSEALPSILNTSAGGK